MIEPVATRGAFQIEPDTELACDQVVRNSTGGWSSFPEGARLAKLLWRRPVLSGFVLVLVLLVAYFVTDAPAAQAATALAEQSGSLNAPAGAQLVTQRSSHKPGQAVLGSEYHVDLSYLEVRSFYDSELSRQGWRLVSDKPVTDSGGPVVGNIACYQKAEFWAVLQYFNSPEGIPADYGLDLVWGSSVCP